MKSDGKNIALETISAQIARCKICKKDTSGLPVAGEGNPDADIVFIGEAPGRTEAAAGRPFIGRSGQLLRKQIRDVGLLEEDVYVTSPVKYLPDSGTPTPAQIAHGRKHLIKQLAIIEPKFVVLLGNTAIRGVLGEKRSILKVHGTVEVKNGIHYFFALHPAAAVRFQKFKVLLLEDFRKLKMLVKI